MVDRTLHRVHQVAWQRTVLSRLAYTMDANACTNPNNGSISSKRTLAVLEGGTAYGGKFLRESARCLDGLAASSKVKAPASSSIAFCVKQWQFDGFVQKTKQGF